MEEVVGSIPTRSTIESNTYMFPPSQGVSFGVKDDVTFPDTQIRRVRFTSNLGRLNVLPRRSLETFSESSASQFLADGVDVARTLAEISCM